MDGYLERQEQEWRRVKWAVWHLAALMRSRKMPSFKAFMGVERKREPDRHNPEERRAEWEEIKRMFGQA